MTKNKKSCKYFAILVHLILHLPTHLMGQILGTQGLRPTPTDTREFESVLKLMGFTIADSFDLFYGLYKYNQNSLDMIMTLK